MTDDSMICHDEDCQVAGCGARAQRRTCDDCGAEGLVTDCGHEAQPRPLAADGHGRMLCDDCAAAPVVDMTANEHIRMTPPAGWIAEGGSCLCHTCYRAMEHGHRAAYTRLATCDVPADAECAECGEAL